MNRIISLIKTQLNLNFSISALKFRFTKEKKKRWEPIVIGLALIMGLGPLYIGYVLLMLGMFAAGMTLNQPELILTMAFLAAQTIIMFFGLFYILGSFYFSQDLDTLVPLPLRPYEVIGSKFVVILINEYITAFPILLAPILIYGIGTAQGVLYWLKALLMTLTAPIIPLSISAIIVMLLMRVINLRRNKDLLAIIGGFVGVTLALGINFFAQKLPQSGGKDFYKHFLESQSGLIEAIGSKFPPSIWATLGLSDNGIGGGAYFILFIGVSILMLAFLLWLANMVFYKALLAGQEVSRKRKAISKKEMHRQYGIKSSPIVAIIKREWKLLLRTPVYAINGLTGSFIGPFMVLVIFFAQKSDQEAMEIMSIIKNPEYALYVALGGLALMLFTSGMNLVASTSISREGNTLWVLKMIPVSPKRQVFAKFIHGYMVSALSVLTTAIILGVFIKISPIRLILVIGIGLIASVSITALNLLIDVFNPKINWNSEQEAMKQNLNGVLGMLISILILALFAVMPVLLIIAGASEWLVYVGLIVETMLLGMLSLWGLLALANRKYREYEA